MTLKSPITELYLYLHLDPVYRLPPVQIKVYPFICILDQPACCVLDTISSGLLKGFCPASPFVCIISMLTQILCLVFTASFHTWGSSHIGFAILHFPLCSSLNFFLIPPLMTWNTCSFWLSLSLKRCDRRGFAILNNNNNKTS